MISPFSNCDCIGFVEPARRKYACDARPLSGTMSSRGKLSHCETNAMFFAPASIGVRNGTPCGSVNTPSFRVAELRRPASSISGNDLYVHQPPKPCLGIDSEQKGDRGERYSLRK